MRPNPGQSQPLNFYSDEHADNENDITNLNVMDVSDACVPLGAGDLGNSSMIGSSAGVRDPGELIGPHPEIQEGGPASRGVMRPNK